MMAPRVARISPRLTDKFMKSSFITRSLNRAPLVSPPLGHMNYRPRKLLSSIHKLVIPLNDCPLMNTKHSFTYLGIPFGVSISNLAGHGSFVLLACSYLETDVLSLRGYALSAIALSITFQYFRKQPLWIPISWNLLFLVINVGMIIGLVKERTDAAHIDEEALSVYENVFRKMGLTTVEFMHLIGCAEKRTFQRGEYFLRGQEVTRRLYIILTGSAEVCTGTELYAVGTIQANQFVGALSFLSYLERGANANDNSKSLSNSTWISSVAVRAAEPCVVYTWSFEQLASVLKREPKLAHAFQGSMSVDLKRKISSGWAGISPRVEHYRGMIEGALINGEISVHEKQRLHAYRQQHSISDETHCNILQSIGWTPADFERGNKQDAEGIGAKYEKLLRSALLAGEGHITEEGRTMLRTFRLQHRLDAHSHLNALTRIGWTQDEFEIGEQGINAALTQEVRKPIPETATEKNRLKAGPTSAEISHGNTSAASKHVVAA